MRVPLPLHMIPTPIRLNTSWHLTLPPGLSDPRGTPRTESGSLGLDGVSGYCRTGSRLPAPSRASVAVGVSLQVHLFVTSPIRHSLSTKMLSEYPPLPVHADLHPLLLEDLGELQAGELASLVGVEHLRLPTGQRFPPAPQRKSRPPVCWTAARPPRTGCASP